MHCSSVWWFDSCFNNISRAVRAMNETLKQNRLLRERRDDNSFSHSPDNTSNVQGLQRNVCLHYCGNSGTFYLSFICLSFSSWLKLNLYDSFSYCIIVLLSEVSIHVLNVSCIPWSFFCSQSIPWSNLCLWGKVKWKMDGYVPKSVST